jgi:hypothetical protein
VLLTDYEKNENTFDKVTSSKLWEMLRRKDSLVKYYMQSKSYINILELKGKQES